MPETDEKFMRMVIRLAQRGIDRPSREPLAGAVVVADGFVVGRGYAREDGADAVVAALDKAGGLAAGATLYTNIEPFCDNTDEACVTRLIDSRVARIVVGFTHENDQFPQAKAGILSQLKTEQIEVATGVCEQACRMVNEKYFKYSATGLPFVTVKFAQSLDGRIATVTGDSQWISSSGARRFAHQLRREHDAIMVGIGTVLADDPQLSVRLVPGRDPLRIVVDSSLRIPLTTRVLANGAASHTLVVTSEAAELTREREIESLGAEVLRLPAGPDYSWVNLERVLEALGRRGIASVLVEGGKGIITSLLAARAVDRVVVVIAPKIIGEGTEAIGNLDITRLNEAITFSSVQTRKLGPDIVFDGRLK
ncbi:MAG: bifunctional diaminohydroxyphosphoribosylaminopyrimidine deaminase/5-amino-6-(5-phosphoribosylamino)uracil reductase RibD [Acidobacteriota bacterium]